MTKHLLLATLALLALPALAMRQEAKPLYTVCKAVTPPDDDAEIIFEVPDGEESFFSRSCTEFMNDYEGLQRNDIKGSVVRRIQTADGTLYFSNPLSDFTLLSYLKGSYDADGSIVIEGPQFIYDEYDDWTDEYVKMYMLPMKREVDDSGYATYVATEDMKYVLKKTDTGYEAENPDLLLGLARYGELADINGQPTGETGYAWVGYGDCNIKLLSCQGSNGVTPPDGAEFDRWVFHDPYEDALINVALQGNDIYIQGIDRGVKDAWVKGTIADGKVTIPSGTYLGINADVAYYSYLWGSELEYDPDLEVLIGGNPTEETVFDYDSESKKLTLQDGYAICSMPDDYYLLTLYEGVTIYKQNRNIATPPAKPYDLEVDPFNDIYEAGAMSFNIPYTDEEGCILDTEKLYYRFYINGEVFTFTPEEYPYLELTENMVNVPYSLYDNYDIMCSGTYHDVYFHFELPAAGCGVQSVYINEEGQEVCSEIVMSGDSGINSPEIFREELSRTYYNLQGHAVDSSYNGPAICRIVYSDGTVKTIKMMRAGR